jgi:hypothetical protein
MPNLIEEEAAARSIGLALLDSSRVYEDFVIPSFEGRSRRRRFPPRRRAIIGLVGRQRRFLRAAYLLADAGQVLEAVGPLRSMLEFLICQRWLADDPDRNWKLWMVQDHDARDLWRSRLREHAPALHDAAVEALSPEQRAEGEAIAAARRKLVDELGAPRPDDRRSLERRADQVGLSFLYDMLYRYESSAATHPTMFAVDLLLDKHPAGLLLRANPTAQFAAPPIYAHGAVVLCEALTSSGELNPKLCIRDLPSLRRDLYELIVRRSDVQIPNWRELIPSEVLNELDAEIDP